MADDVEARVRVAEEELNLLKNQVQQTLLDVREHVLDLVESGTSIPQVDRPAENTTESETTTEVSFTAPLPPTQTGAAPLPNLGGDAGLGAMPGLDMGGDAGLGAMPGLDMGGDAGPDPMAGLEVGGDAGMGEMPGFDPGAGMDTGFDDTPGDDVGGGFDAGMEDAPFDSSEQMSAGPGIVDAPYDDSVTSPAQAPRPPRSQAPRQDQDVYSQASGDDYDYTEPAPLPDDPPVSAPPDAFQAPVEAVAAPETGPPVSLAVDPALAEMDLVTLVGVVRWVDQAVQRLGQRRVDALLDVWQMTGRISEPTKEMIQRLCALTHEDQDERVPLRELVAMMIQMEAVLDTKETSNSRLLAMLFDDPGDPLAGLGSLARH